MRALLTKPLNRYKVRKDNSGPTSLYLFNEVGNIVRDEVGGYDLALSSSPTGSWQLGPEGLEYYHGVVVTGDSWTAQPDLALASFPFSIVGRARNPVESEQVIWSMGTGGYYFDALKINTNGNFVFEWNTSAGSGSVSQSGLPTQDLNYHTYVAVANSNTNRAIYFDGEKVATQTSGNSGSFTPERTRVGERARDSGGKKTKGYTSLCAVYSNRALTDEEVAHLG